MFPDTIILLTVIFLTPPVITHQVIRHLSLLSESPFVLTSPSEVPIISCFSCLFSLIPTSRYGADEQRLAASFRAHRQSPRLNCWPFAQSGAQRAVLDEQYWLIRECMFQIVKSHHPAILCWLPAAQEDGFFNEIRKLLTS